MQYKTYLRDSGVVIFTDIANNSVLRNINYDYCCELKIMSNDAISKNLDFKLKGHLIFVLQIGF